jgi:hypothetical protein
MAADTKTAPETIFPTPMGSLERTVEEDDTLTSHLDLDWVDVEDSSDDESTELDRLMIRLGGNGF